MNTVRGASSSRVARHPLAALAIRMGAMSFAVVSLVSHATTTVTRTTGYDYDASGLLVKEVVEPDDPNLCMATAYRLDSYGRREATIRRNCNGSAPITPSAPSEAAAPQAPMLFPQGSVTHTFSADQRFIATSTNALGQIEETTYAVGFGSLRTHKDANGLTTEWRYDGYGRKLVERRPDGHGTRWSYQLCGATTCPVVAGASPAYVITTTPIKSPIDLNAPGNAAASGPYTKAYYDALGREIRTETEGFDGDPNQIRLVLRDTEYDNAGRVARQSRAYYSGSTPSWISYLYDERSRVKQVTEPTAGGIAEHTTVYNGLTVSRIGPLGTTVEHRDTAGHVVRVVDAKGAALESVFDPWGNLVQTTDPKGNLISAVFDTRGRRTALYDPDFGVWTFAYNPTGAMVRQTDAKQQAVDMAYDSLGRLVRRNAPGLSGAWYFDNYADGAPCKKGMLCEVRADNGHTRRLAYDALSRQVGTTNVVGATYTSPISYDSLGRMDTQTYPGGYAVRHTYTSRLGYPLQVIDLRTNTAIWTAGDLDASGRPLRYTYGNGTVTDNEYYVDGRLKSSNAVRQQQVHNLSLTYDTAGQLRTRVETTTGLQISYEHDELGRLTRESRSGGGVAGTDDIRWAYDSLGNIESRTEAGTIHLYSYAPSGQGSRRPHAVTGVAGTVNGYVGPVYGYDDNGNLTAGAGRAVTWTGFNRVESITKEGRRLDYVYDVDFDRVRESFYQYGALQRSTVYLNPGSGAGLYYEEETGVAGTKKKHYVSADGSTVAMVVNHDGNWTTQYWHKDHLGSTTTVENGSVVERAAYEAFGKRRNPNGVTDTNGTLAVAATDRGYTGHEHQDEVGLVNMNGRIYDPALGRVLSPDPVVRSETSLQSYNRYSYVENSPLTSTDPTGLEVWFTTTNADGNRVNTQYVSDGMGGGSNSYTSQSVLVHSPFTTSAPSLGLQANSIQYVGEFFSSSLLAGAVPVGGEGFSFGEAATQFGRQIAADFVDNHPERFGFQGWLADKFEVWFERPDTRTPGGWVGSATAVAAPLFLPGLKFGKGKGGELTFDKAARAWTSGGGLVYGQGSTHGNRLKHVLAHTVPDPSKPLHTVFNVGRDRVVGLLDEAWARRSTALPNDPGAYVIPMGRVVGQGGETSIKIIVRPGTSEVITAFPFK